MKKKAQKKASDFASQRAAHSTARFALRAKENCRSLASARACERLTGECNRRRLQPAAAAAAVKTASEVLPVRNKTCRAARVDARRAQPESHAGKLQSAVSCTQHLPSPSFSFLFFFASRSYRACESP